MLRLLRRSVLFCVALGRDMAAHSGIGKHAVRSSYLLVMVFALISSAATAQTLQVSPAINVMPMPATVTPLEGRLILSHNFHVGNDGDSEPRLQRALQRFVRDLARQTGYFVSDPTADDLGH